MSPYHDLTIFFVFFYVIFPKESLFKNFSIEKCKKPWEQYVEISPIYFSESFNLIAMLLKIPR